MVKCPNCGCENPDGNYCRACGTKLAADRIIVFNNQNNKDMIDKFNSQFLKYYRLDTCTAHDIVSIANLAKNSNEYYELEEGSGYNYYVNVIVEDYIDNNGSATTELNFEKLDDAKYTEFIQNNSTVEEKGKIKEIKYFTCTNISQSNITGRVYQITFKAN